ncbi:hypothetical protein MWH28_11655 [Natroniella sulfidigena]|uniref:hypothetical protein n=1 Tax=Natroniella sulfidigena TaxID=723921 RepID=UPI00200B8ABC|nr:hypothetical protein [Natroniella sulfidigena]MCK8818012.1 hypothetical protein [Natroniella sulfidigena]
MIKQQKLTLLLVILLMLSFSTTAFATFTTGEGKRTYKIDSFRVDERIRLQSFLVGLGIDEQTSLNFKLTIPNDTDEPMDFLIPYQKPGEFFHLGGPILDIKAQYIPRHRLFVTDSALNAVQVGLKNYRGEYRDEEGRPIEEDRHLDKTYLVFGVLSRSRWNDHNLFSDLNLAYEPGEEGGWFFDSQVGMEFNLKRNFRGQIAYRAIGAAGDAKLGFSLGLKVDY